MITNNHLVSVIDNMIFLLYTVLEAAAADKAISALRQASSGSKSTIRKRKVKDEVKYLSSNKLKEQVGNIDLYALHTEIGLRYQLPILTQRSRPWRENYRILRSGHGCKSFL